MTGVYRSLEEVFEGSLKLEEQLIDVKPGANLGPLVSEASANAASAEEAWKLLPVTVAALAHALTDSTRTTADGKIAYLRITSQEKRDFLSEIALSFNPDVAAGKSAGFQPAAASAGLLAYFLHQPWRGSEQR
jgi:hypothetical protein